MDTRRQTMDTERLLRNARSRVESLVEQGESDAATLVLRDFPEFANDQESAIEIIYAEFLALEACGRLPKPDSWLDRFPSHRPRLERLLKLHDFLSTDPSASIQSLENQVDRDRVTEQDVALQPFAKYEILDELGRGGMGIVYRARQHGLGRIVALKVLRLMENDPKVRIRFQQEAETVASLQHPNIVQVIEISLEEGKEFLSMEYLGGGTLDAKLQERNWSNHEIAELIRTLAEAIHYAHERGIVHRDLKPANILFTSEQVPKIVDFGLAKRIHDELRPTWTGALLGTPCYMSPEQASGSEAPIGFSTDVYSLGVILYLMLAKRLPFEGKTAIETMRWIVDRESVPPSKWSPGVPRDLETICLKCLAKSPAARYGSARALADDLARFLDHIPVHARRLGAIERWGRTIRRHPIIATLTASIVAMVIGASSLLYLQYRTVHLLSRENAEHIKSEARLRERVSQAEGAYEASLRKARASVKEWTQLGLRLDSEPGMDGLRRKAFEDAVAHYQECMSANPGDDAVRFEAAVAAIRAAYFHADIGRYELAESELRTADRWLEPLPANEQVQWNRGDIQILLANTLRRVDRWEESLHAYENTIKILGELIEANPMNTGYLIRQSNALVNLCVVFKYQSQWDESLRTYAQAIRLSTRAAGIRANQKIPEFLARDTVVDLKQVPTALDEATDYLSDLCQRLKVENPKLLDALAKENYLPEIALCLDDAGQVFEIQADIIQAETSFRKAIELRRLTQVLAQENRRIDQFLARSETNLGKLLFANDRFDEACMSLNAADLNYSKLVDDFPERTDCRLEWGQCLITLAKCSRSRHDLVEAARYAGKAVEELKFVAGQSRSSAIQDSLANYKLLHSHYLRLSGDEENAEREWKEAVEIAKDREGPCNSHAWMLALEERLSESDKAIALELSDIATKQSPQSKHLWNTRALVFARVGRWDECRDAIEKAIRLGNGGTPSDWYIKAMALAGRNEVSEAKYWFSMAESVRSSQSPSHSELRRQSQLARSLLDRNE